MPRGFADPAPLAQVWLSLWRCVTMEMAPIPYTTPQPPTGPTQSLSSMPTRRCHAGEAQLWAPVLC